MKLLKRSRLKPHLLIWLSTQRRESSLWNAKGTSLEQARFLPDSVLLALIQATQANEIIHGMNQSTCACVNGVLFLLFFSHLLHDICEEDGVRHGVKNHHEGEGHDESNGRSTKRKEKGILHIIRAKGIFKTGVVLDDDLRRKQRVMPS